MAPEDRYGLDEETNPNQLASVFGTVVPQRLVRKGLEVDVTTDRNRYDAGDPVEITVELRNRLPFPVTLSTPQRRLWGWTVEGYLEASDELRYADGERGTLDFRGRERKRFTRQWDGRIKHEGERTEWEQATGEVEIAAFVAVGAGRPADSTSVTIR
jgi:hypothetical protein